MRYTKDASGRERELTLNRVEMEKLIQGLSKLTGLYSQMFIHIIELYYQGILYDLANRSLDNDVDNIKIEIPFIGGLYLSYKDKEIVFDRFEFENEFIEDINNALENKTCRLDSMIEEKYVSKIMSSYEELV